MESKGNIQGGDSDHALIGQSKKVKGKGPGKGKGKRGFILTDKEEGLEKNQELHMS